MRTEKDKNDMREFKGTKGKLIALEDATGFCVFTERDIVCRTNNKPTKEKAKYNTRLYASAPELLEALQNLVNIFNPDNQSIYEFARKDIEKAKQAIDKALNNTQN